MLARGMGLVKIAKALGLSFYAAKGILKRGREGLRLLEEEGPTRWRDEDFERFLDRMRIEHRTVAEVCGIRIFRGLLLGMFLGGSTRSSWKNSARPFTDSHIICSSRPANSSGELGFILFQNGARPYVKEIA